MNRKTLHAAIARATGEDVTLIRHRGFNLVDPLDSLFDHEPDNGQPQMIDWDDFDQTRIAVASLRCVAPT